MNILGENFDSYVNTQVNVRQEKHAVGFGETRTTEDITFMNSKTSFARLMSSVEVSDISNYKNVNALGLTGLELAKNYVLFAGTSTSTSGFQRSGLTLDGAYGIGGFELGYRPMPGISSVEVKTDGNGFTTSATVKIKAFNRQQLEILDALYFRLGYYMLLEWGNVIYWDNDKRLISDPHNNSLQDYFFNPNNKDINDVLVKIKEKRIQSCGNYDALFGKVINFNWTYAADNTFDITINLRSIGDIIESLKINSAKTITEESTETTEASGATPPPYEYYKNKNSIGKLYYNVVKKIFDRGGEFFREPANSKLKGEISFTRIPFQGENAGYKYYVKFSRLLYELQESNIFTFNGTSKALEIDFNSINNLIPTNEITLSVDPNICIIRRTDDIDLNPLFPGFPRQLPKIKFNYYPDLDDFLYTDVPDVLYGKLMNIYINFDFILEKIDAFTDIKTQRAPFKELLNEILSNISSALGSSNKLECFIEEETNTLKIIDKNPYPFKDELLKSLGFEIRETTKFNVTGYYGANNQSPNNSTSFIKNINLQTQIPPEFATIISIGAAANKKVVGEDTTAFSKLNKGLKTRFAENIIDGQEKITDTSVDETPNALLEAILPLANWVASGNATQGRNIQWNLDTFASNKSILADLIKYMNKIKSKEDEKSADSTSSPTSGFIPVNISLTMDGLSGMKVFQKFDLDSSYLPSNYPDAVEILIKGVSHTIQNNIWDTTIESVIVGKSSVKSLATPRTPVSSDNKAQSRGYTESSNGNPLPHTNDPNISSIRNAILRVAKGYVGQSEIPGFDNQKFIDPAFEAQMKSIGWYSSPTAYWCNWFTNLVWREAYSQVGATDPKIQNIFKTKLDSKVLPPLTAGCFRTLDVAVSKGFGKNLGGINIQSAKNVALPKPGDMIIYSSGHTNICVAVDPINRTFDTIGGNEGTANSRNGSSVKLTRKYWSTQKIKGIISVIEN